jgi:hypothetical protein
MCANFCFVHGFHLLKIVVRILKIMERILLDMYSFMFIYTHENICVRYQKNMPFNKDKKLELAWS